MEQEKIMVAVIHKQGMEYSITLNKAADEFGIVGFLECYLEKIKKDKINQFRPGKEGPVY